LAKWYKEGVESNGGEISYEDAREHIYGEPFENWKAAHQKAASEEQLEKMEEIKLRKEAKK
jgi:hypothetical protein